MKKSFSEDETNSTNLSSKNVSVDATDIIPTAPIIEPPKHKCFEVLQLKRRAVKKMSDRIDVLSAIVDLSVKSYIPKSMLDDEEFHHWHCLTSAFSNKPRSWSMDKTADCMCRFDVIMDRTNAAKDQVRLRYPAAITNFLNFMKLVHNEAEVAINENLHSRRVKLGNQKGNNMLQDNVDLSKLDNDSFDTENCVVCHHKFVMPIGMDINEITQFNTKITKAHSIKMTEWNNTPFRKKGTKPRPGKGVSQHLACMCCKMTCIDNVNGAGCLKCESACRNAIAQGSEARPFFDKNFESTCMVCKCACNVIYFRHEGKKFAKQRQIEIERKNNTLSQPKLNAFFAFTKDIKTITHDYIDKGKNINDALA